MVAPEGSIPSKETGTPELSEEVERAKVLSWSKPHYGSITGNQRDTCPTCQGTGRIPRGHKDQLVAVIPCNDVRLKPRRTKMYVCFSMALCLFLCCLMLFFLFPRSVALVPVSVQSVLVYYTQYTVDMEVTNLINISNDNFVAVQIVELDVQGVISGTVVGKCKMFNMSTIPSRSRKAYTVQINLSLVDEGFHSYCRSSTIRIHVLLLELQMTMNISYLSHTEQLSLSSYEYIDCGANSTIPHPVRWRATNNYQNEPHKVAL